MFDYDELWEPSPDDPKSEAPTDEAGLVAAGRIRVTARHAVRGTEIKVFVPKKAKFKHIKKALARRLDNPEILTKGQLLNKVDGAYTAYKDSDPVDDVEEVLALGFDLSVAEGSGSRMAACLSDSELTEEERDWVTVEYVGAKEKTSRGHGAAVPSAVPRRGPHVAQADRETASSTARQPGKVATVAIGGDRANSWQLPRVGGLARPRLRPRMPAAPVPAQRAAGVEGHRLTKAEAMSLFTELYELYKEDEFQEELRLLREEAEYMSRTDFVQTRQDLFFLVQRQVLPRYGFEESQAGVFRMMAAVGPFVEDADFVHLATKVNELVGIDNPPERWASLQQACAKWDYPEGTPCTKPS
eukprot:CAMPEP_0179071118 /NCGR_PEP_ID=MMETSP0796-20121207/31369_1 /TAXON_ID=73915 /ORGANISM="Pyrodinium bahamense, Strain pbaha01" /LENGTH=356 /DNA_ID=CAMNT_0020768227 /DNA_START=1 /DNA_END=1071 /DNA_ORIENTATION=-